MNGWKGIFQVSNTGKVRRLYKRGPKELKSVVKRGGYKGVLLKANGIFKCELIHRLVATAFIPNPDNLPHVNHKDEDKTNNSIDNLEWCDAKYNNNYGTCIERRADRCKKNVQQFDLSGALIKNWHGIVEAAVVLQIDPSSITKAAKGKRKSAGGFIWRYKDDN